MYYIMTSARAHALLGTCAACPGRSSDLFFPKVRRGHHLCPEEQCICSEDSEHCRTASLSSGRTCTAFPVQVVTSSFNTSERDEATKATTYACASCACVRRTVMFLAQKPYICQAVFRSLSITF